MYDINDGTMVIVFKEYPALIKLASANHKQTFKTKSNYPLAVRTDVPRHMPNRDKYNYMVNMVLDGATPSQLDNIEMLITNDLY